MSPPFFLLGALVVCYLCRRMTQALPTPSSSEIADFVSAKRASSREFFNSEPDVEIGAYEIRKDDFEQDSFKWSENAFNIDGTPMLNDCVDIHGNAFGITGDDWLTNSFD